MEKRRSPIQRIMAALLSAVLVTGTLSEAAPLTAQAADSRVTDFATLKSTIESAQGEYTLVVAADIEMTDTITVPAGSNVSVLSDGSYTLKRKAGFQNAMFEVNGSLNLGAGTGKSLTLDGGAVWTGSENSVLGRGTSNSGIGANQSLLVGNKGGSISLGAGTVLQNNAHNDSGCGGAITLLEENHLTLCEGSVIRNNYAGNGGSGGAVKTYFGSGITMTGGEIYGNQADRHGGAFQIYGAKLGASTISVKASCQISGGTIRNNQCNRYGGGIAVSNHSDVSISGNTRILNNRTTGTTYPGGGIAFADDDTSLTLSDSLMIFGNTRGDGRNDNLHIGSKSCNKVTLNNIAESSRIGIVMSNGTGVFSNTAGADYNTSFFSDDTKYCVKTESGNALALRSSGITITAQPAAPAYPDDKTISVAASGSNLSYQWYHYREQETGAAIAEGISTQSTYTLPDSLAAGTHFYYCRVADNSGNSIVTNVIKVESSGSEAAPQEHSCEAMGQTMSFSQFPEFVGGVIWRPAATIWTVMWI